MNKIQTLTVSILLILAAIVMHLFLDKSVKLDEELIGFLTGACFAGGIVMFFSTFFKKKT